MKNQTMLCLALVLALPLAACGEKKAADSMKDAVSTATAKIDDVKASFTKMTESEMGSVSKSIADLQAKAASFAGEKKAEIDTLVKNIGAKKDELMKEFEELKSTTVGANFDALKTKITTGIAELKKLIDDAMAKLK